MCSDSEWQDMLAATYSRTTRITPGCCFGPNRIILHNCTCDSRMPMVVFNIRQRYGLVDQRFKTLPTSKQLITIAFQLCLIASIHVTNTSSNEKE